MSKVRNVNKNVSKHDIMNSAQQQTVVFDNKLHSPAVGRRKRANQNTEKNPEKDKQQNPTQCKVRSTKQKKNISVKFQEEPARNSAVLRDYHPQSYMEQYTLNLVLSPQSTRSL